MGRVLFCVQLFQKSNERVGQGLGIRRAIQQPEVVREISPFVTAEGRVPLLFDMLDHDNSPVYPSGRERFDRKLVQ